jgi:hypothetical protein
MTALIQIHGSSAEKNLAKAVLYMQSAAAISPQTVVEVAHGIDPAIPALPPTRGAGIWKDSFQLISTGQTETTIKAELPYSPRQFAYSLNLRASILPVPGAVAPAFGGTASTTPAPDSPENLEQYLYDRAKALGAKIQAVTINGVAKIVIEAVVSQPLSALLAPDGGAPEQ